MTSLVDVFPSAAPNRPVVIGMVHLPPLVGSPRYSQLGPAPFESILRDAESLLAGGVDGLIVENYGDAPFYPGAAPPETVAQLTAAALSIRQRFDRPIGVNVLRNDGLAALAVAIAAGAAFIRVNVLASARLTDQGVIQGIAHDLLRKRQSLHAGKIQIFADVDVKHSAPLAPRPIEEETLDLIERAGADALIVSGAATGRPVDLDQLSRVRSVVAGRAPVLVGSGVTAANAREIGRLADGLIVGTWFKEGGQVLAPVDRARVAELIEQLDR